MRKFSNDYDFLEIHDQVVNCVNWDQQNIYCGCLSGDVIELTKDEKSKKYYTSRTSSIHNLVVTDIYSSLDGSKIVTSSLDGKCFVTEKPTMRQIREIDCPDALSPHCTINGDGTSVAVVGQSGHLYIDDLTKTTSIPIEGPDAKEAFFKAVRFFGNNDNEVVCLSRHALFEIDVETQKIVNSLTGGSGKKVGELKRSNNCLAVSSRDQKIIALGTVRGYIQLFDLSSSEKMHLIHEIKVGGELIEKIEFSNDGRTLAIAGSNKRISLLDMAMLEHPYNEQQRSRIISISFNHDSTQIVSASEDKTVIIADIIEGEKSQ